MKLPVTLSGKVIHGNSLGNTYDSPTANIVPAEDVSRLAHGVYYSLISIEGENHPAITNLGVRPTVSDDGGVNAETYIYDHSKDIYDMDVTVTLLEFSRPEKKFATVDELYETVEADIRAGAHFHGLASSSSASR